ncbi:hypothetical protein RDI58_024323 [Solanum bulbocastanum]|uniref:Uncharacterized protein n=1 Tax=Solanum bulbocastanum TaxID=147425 RepID=A0AAN8SXF9_SOLBU
MGPFALLLPLFTDCDVFLLVIYDNVDGEASYRDLRVAHIERYANVIHPVSKDENKFDVAKFVWDLKDTAATQKKTEATLRK